MARDRDAAPGDENGDEGRRVVVLRVTEREEDELDERAHAHEASRPSPYIVIETCGKKMR